MSTTKRSYQQILKATSIFGGVQVMNIVISLIRSKFVAIWLGPLGMGIIGLLNSSLNIISEFSKMGIDTTAVREISIANEESDKRRVVFAVGVINRILWITGLLGMVLTIMLSPILSKLAFGDYQHTLAFVWVSVSLLFQQLAQGQLAILQGFRKLKSLAKASLYGNLLGLILSLPLYYYFQVDAIVPTIIASSLLAFLISRAYSKNIERTNIRLGYRQVIKEGKHMLKLGFMISLRGLITLVTAYLIQVFISYYGGVDEVGYYMAGYMIINSYVGIIFKAMRTDYFPRLSAIIHDRTQMNMIVYQQAIIATLIITPIILVFLIAIPLVINVLYSKQFLVIEGYLSWAILATLFQALSWSIGYVILAKGDSNLFIKTAIFFNVLFFCMEIAGYHFWGLTGMGIALLVYYFFHFIGVFFITKVSYGLSLPKGLYLIFLFSIVLCAMSVIFSVFSPFLKYTMMTIIAFISAIFSLNELDKRIGLIEYIKHFLHKK